MVHRFRLVLSLPSLLTLHYLLMLPTQVGVLGVLTTMHLESGLKVKMICTLIFVNFWLYFLLFSLFFVPHTTVLFLFNRITVLLLLTLISRVVQLARNCVILRYCYGSFVLSVTFP